MSKLKLLMFAVAAILIVALVGASVPVLFGATKDSVVAIVNGEEITRSTLETRLREAQTLYEAGGIDLDQRDMKQQVLNDIITETLILQRAAADGITATPGEIESQYQSIAEQFSDQATFQQQLANQNLTAEILRERIAQQLVIEAFIDANLDEDDLQVTDEEVEALYENYSAQLDEVPSLDEVRPELENELRQQRISQAIDRLINELKSESKIEVFL